LGRDHVKGTAAHQWNKGGDSTVDTKKNENQASKGTGEKSTGLETPGNKKKKKAKISQMGHERESYAGEQERISLKIVTKKKKREEKNDAES